MESTRDPESIPPDPTPAYAASTVKHGAIYFLGNALSRLAGFIMLPVYTRVLTTADYGVLEILALSTDVLGMLAGLGIRQAVVRLYYQYDGEADRNLVVSTASLMLVGIFALAAVLGLVLSGSVTDVLLGDGQPTRYAMLAIVAFAVGALGDVPAVHLQAMQRSTHLVTANLIRLLLALTLNIVFVVVLRLGVDGVFLSTIVSATAVGGVMMAQMFRRTGVHFHRRVARELVSFGTPLVFSNLGSFVLHFSDRFFLRYSHSLAVVGVYALSYKLALVSALFVNGPFYAIWSAKALEIAHREGEAAPPILRSILSNYVLVVVTAAFGVALFAPDVVRIALGPDFEDAAKPVPLLSLAIVFFSFRHVAQTGAMIAKRSDHIAIVSSGAAVVAILANLALIPSGAAQGAALATAIAFASEFFAMRTFSERSYRIGISLWRTLGPVGVASGWVGAALVLIPPNVPTEASLALRFAILAGYAVTLRATGLLTASATSLLVRSARDPRAIMRTLRAA